MTQISFEMKDFNLQCFLDAANELVRADETERALRLLNNLPGYYRDNQPKEVVTLKNKILSRIATPADYVNIERKMQPYPAGDPMGMAGTLRAQILSMEIKRLNDRELAPLIVDYGPGEYWLPTILLESDLDFSYQPRCLDHELYQRFKSDKRPLHDEGSALPIIFCAFEIIEHLQNEEDLKSESLKCGVPDIIHASTPMYTFDTECTDWDATKGELGHLRTYTPNEFHAVLSRLFPEYTLMVYAHKIMHARLVLKDSECLAVKETKDMDILSVIA